MQLLNKNLSTANRPVQESDIRHLPEPVKKWLRNAGAVGKPYISCGKVTQIAEMQMKPEQDNWLAAKAIPALGRSPKILVVAAAATSP